MANDSRLPAERPSGRGRLSTALVPAIAAWLGPWSSAAAGEPAGRSSLVGSAGVCAWGPAIPHVVLEPANLLSFVAGAVLASLGEYWGHRFLHLDLAVAEVHREHHRLNAAQGVLREALDYVKGGLVCCLPLASVLWFGVAPSAGLALTAGAALYGVFAAYAHQLQHENPRGCFWMPMPVHYVHHKFNMRRWNFGIAVDIWDRVFGTYKVVAWDGERERAAERRGLLRITWR